MIARTWGSHENLLYFYRRKNIISIKSSNISPNDVPLDSVNYTTVYDNRMVTVPFNGRKKFSGDFFSFINNVQMNLEKLSTQQTNKHFMDIVWGSP